MSIAVSRAQKNFEEQVDAWVSEALRSGSNTFGELLSNLPGVFPTTALNSVHRLQRSRRISAAIARRLKHDAHTACIPRPLRRDSLLPPHPLDFEWRFTAAAAEGLLARAQSLTGGDDRVLLLGTPSLAALAIRTGVKRSTTFVGEDNAITGSIVARNKAARNPLEVRVCGAEMIVADEAGLVLLDPPWYFDFIRPMLAAAAAACRPDGHILLSAPSIGSASSAAEDRNHAPSVGLVTRARKARWHELVIGRIRVFVTRDPPSRIAPDFGLYSIVPGDVLPSISRRDPRRRKAGVWTSGNRIFGTHRPDLVLLAGARVSREPVSAIEGSIQLSTAERDEVEQLSYAMLNLARNEEAEERRGHVEEVTWRNKALKLNSPISSTRLRNTNFG